MKIRVAKKVIDSIHRSAIVRVPTWRRAVARYKKYQPTEDWIRAMFQRLFDSAARVSADEAETK